MMEMITMSKRLLPICSKKNPLALALVLEKQVSCPKAPSMRNSSYFGGEGKAIENLQQTVTAVPASWLFKFLPQIRKAEAVMSPAPTPEATARGI